MKILQDPLGYLNQPVDIKTAIELLSELCQNWHNPLVAVVSFTIESVIGKKLDKIILEICKIDIEKLPPTQKTLLTLVLAFICELPANLLFGPSSLVSIAGIAFFEEIVKYSLAHPDIILTPHSIKSILKMCQLNLLKTNRS